MQKISFGNFGKTLDFIAKGKVWRLAKNRLMRILGDIMVIRMRHTRAHTGNRRSHHALKANTIVNDAETGTSHLRHRVNMETGMYRGRQVIDVTKKALKNAKKSR